VVRSRKGPPGNPRAFDVVTGKKLWEFQTVPRPGEKYNDTWGDGWKDRGGTNMWGFAAPIDVERGIVYLPIAGPATNYYGGDRRATTRLRTQSLLSSPDGKYLWHFQTVHHDIWDYRHADRQGRCSTSSQTDDARPAIRAGW
jgi:quinoprotein glucose dehydrogenase